MKTADI